MIILSELEFNEFPMSFDCQDSEIIPAQPLIEFSSLLKQNMHEIMIFTRLKIRNIFFKRICIKKPKIWAFQSGITQPCVNRDFRVPQVFG